MEDRTWEGRMLAILNGLEATTGISRNALKKPVRAIGDFTNAAMGVAGSDLSPFNFLSTALFSRSTADRGLSKFLGLEPVSDNEPFPLSSVKVTKYGPEIRKVVDALPSGGSKDLFVEDMGGDRAARAGDSVQYEISPSNADLTMMGTATGDSFSPGKFIIKVGKDETGAPYYELSDTYDFHEGRVDKELSYPPAAEAGKAFIGLLNALGRGFDTKSRYFFDPLTGKIPK